MSRTPSTLHATDWRVMKPSRQQVPLSLTQSAVLGEAPLPRLLVFCIAIMAGLMSLFIGWASLTHIDEIATANGQIVPSGYVQAVQQLDGGIVKDILVEEGQVVQTGQVLLRLDSTNANADLGQMKARQRSLQLQAMRYKSFVDGKRMATRANDAWTAPEQTILTSMVNARNSQRRVLADQLAQKQKELAALTTTRQALDKNLQLLTEQTNMYQDMADKGAGSRMMVMNSERDVNQLQGQLDETISGQQRANDAIREINSRMQSLDADLQQDALKNLGQVEAELRELNETLQKTTGAANRTVIRAPIDGVVKGLTVHTLGAVIQSGQVLMEIVPIHEQMIAEAAVLPADIGPIRVGQPVKLKISTYDFARYGSIAGKVSNISATTFQTEKGETFYKVKVILAHDYVGRNRNTNKIAPGMTLQANIITGEKSIMQYLLKPVQYALDGAMHES